MLRGSRGRASPRARRFASAPGWSDRSSGRISSRISPRAVSGFVASTRTGRSCSLAVRHRLFARHLEERTDDAVLATHLDSARRAARHDPVEDRLDLIGRGMPRGAKAEALVWRRSAGRASRLRSPPARHERCSPPSPSRSARRPRRPRRPALRGGRARPRPRSRARAARARGTSSLRRRRRGTQRRHPAPPARGRE